MSGLPVLSSPFRPTADFEPTEGYCLLPLRFMPWNRTEVLITNDAGEFYFLERSAFESLVRHALPRDSACYADLKSKHFLNDTSSDTAVELLATKYRTTKAFLHGFTRLHLFVVTLRCDHTCRYCQVSRAPLDRSRYDMSKETASAAIDLMFRSPSPTLKIEFQGGESLLNFSLIRWIVEEVERRNEIERRDLQFVIATNLVPLTDDILEFCRSHEVLLSTSLDGPAAIHNANRPRPGGNSHAIALEGIARARAALGNDQVSAIMTTSRRSLQAPVEIVDEYVEHGFGAIFLRPISPYGFAIRTGESSGYEADEFLDFYRTALARIIEWNRMGTPLVEVYSQILLTKMLTPFPTGYVDLQSPAGTGIAAVAYNYDGDVYASDESRMLAEMGNQTFRLGNVRDHSYEEIFGGALLRRIIGSSVLEALPGCTDCAFLPYCGADPVFNQHTQGDMAGHRPTSAFCSKNMGILHHLFDLLRGGDHFTRELFLSWATHIESTAAEGVAS